MLPTDIWTKNVGTCIRGAHLFFCLTELVNKHFVQFFMRIPKIKNLFKIGHTQSMHKLSLNCQLNFAEQVIWAELVRRWELFDQKIKMVFIIRVEELDFWE